MKLLLATLLIILLFTPGILLAQTQTTRSGSDCGPIADGLCNPVSGITNVPDFLKAVMIFVGGLLGLIAITTIVYAGVRMLLANGNDKTITDAKTTITYTIVGFVGAVMAYTIIVAIENFIGVQTTQNNSNVIFNPFGDGVTLKMWFETILKRVIEISGLVALLMIIWFGFRYLTARGDDAQVKSAKKGILWSLVGLIVILFAYVIISAVANLIS